MNPWVVKPVPEGAGFDTTLTDQFRLSVRAVLRDAARPDDSALDMTSLGRSLWPDGFDRPWRFVQGPENHDIVYRDREDRIARLADPSNPRSWHGRSRSRVAMGLTLTAPGIPMLFMGQEFLEDKQWSDNLELDSDRLLHWAGLDGGDRQMADHVRFTRDLIDLRRRYRALRAGAFRVVHAHDSNRVLAVHRWLEGEGGDVLVVAHLSNASRYGYRIGFPSGGEWREVLNSDAYENWVNPDVAGNGGRVHAEPWPLQGFEHSTELVLPANAILVFAR